MTSNFVDTTNDASTRLSHHDKRLDGVTKSEFYVELLEQDNHTTAGAIQASMQTVTNLFVIFRIVRRNDACELEVGGCIDTQCVVNRVVSLILRHHQRV